MKLSELVSDPRFDASRPIMMDGLTFCSTIEPALNVRGRRAPGAAAPARRFDIGGAPRRMPFSNANQLPAEGSTHFDGMPDTDPDVELPPAAPPTRSPAPTVTIVRRRSRLVQK